MPSRRDYAIRFAADIGRYANTRVVRWLQALSQLQYAFLLAMLGVALILCAMGSTPGFAFAAEGQGTLTIVSQNETPHSYSAYRLLAGSVQGGNMLSTASTDECVPASVWEQLGAPSGGSRNLGTASVASDAFAAWLNEQVNGSNKGAFLDSLRDAVLASKAQPAATFKTGDTVTLPEGYWMVVSGKARPVLVMVTAGEDAQITEKVSVPTSEKQIYNDAAQTWGTAAALEIGKPLRYRLVGTLPSDIEEYQSYTYWFIDTPGAGLTLNHDSVKAEILHEDGTVTDLPLAVEVEGETMRVGTDDLWALHDSWVASDKLVVEYTANITAEALKSGLVPNEVELEYTNQPETFDFGNPPTSLVYAFSYNLSTAKVEEGTTTALQGAKFTLQNASGFYLSNNSAWVEEQDDGCIYTTDEDGNIYFSGLGADVYTLTEIEAPAGYLAIEAPITITITADPVDATQFDVTVAGNGATLLGVDGATLTANLQIEDPENPENPPVTPEPPEPPEPGTPETPGTPKTENPSNPATPTTESTPRTGGVLTGDTMTDILLIIAVAVVAGALAAFASTRKKRKDDGHPGG